MEKQQELEWTEAQKIVISEDLVAAAKQQLQFLESIDRNRHLYNGPALQRAIYRCKNCWLPLLAKHAESRYPETPLVVPLDCEWIWHCHRLNPVRYMADCKELYGRILDSRNVVSSVMRNFGNQTEEIWKMMYPNEPYELDLSGQLENDAENKLAASPSTNYDLVSAVKRQSPFYYQVAKSYMKDDIFLEGAVERYKGFLHLIRRNAEMKLKRFCVPTFDIDLIWHSQQLHPVSYCKDLVAILGQVLEHDDMGSDRTKGEKLDVGFYETTKQWEETFGSRYRRAAAMYRGSAPSPLAINLCPSNAMSKKVASRTEYQNMIQLPNTMLVEVMLEIVGVRNLPASHKGNLVVSISKKQPDMIFNTKKRLNILSDSGEKQAAVFQCEPTGELLIELMSYSPFDLSGARLSSMMGTTSIPLQDVLNPVSKLSVEKWFDLVPESGNAGSQPISLRVAVSVTAPVPAPYVLHMFQGHPFSRNSSFFPLPERVQQAKNWTSVEDEAGNDVISIQMRDSKKLDGSNKCCSKKEVIGMSRSGETRVLAEFIGEGWVLMGSQWFFQLQKTIGQED